MSGLPYRSKLAPFEGEIVTLRNQRPPVPYRRIVELLKAQHGVEVTINGVFVFLNSRKKWDRIHRSEAEPLTSSKGQSLRARVPIKAATLVPPAAGAAPARPVETLPRSTNVPLLRPKPGGRTLKSFTPSSEYNLERLTPEQMAEWLEELKREEGG